MAKNDTLKTASVLAFERKLDPSDALFRAGQWEDRSQAAKWKLIPVREKSVRGTISNRLKAKDQDPAKVDAKIEDPNLQTVDVAALPHDADTLAVRFTLRVLAGAGTPSACNNAEYQKKLAQTVSGYVSEHGFDEIVVTTFTAGSGFETLPVWIYSNFSRPNNVPLVNVMATFVMVVSIPLAWLAQRLSDGGDAG